MEQNPSYFYLKVTPYVEARSEFIPFLEKFAEDNKEQIYVLSAPLTDNKYGYDYSKGYFVLMPKRRIVFISLGDEEDRNNFDLYIDDVLEDVSSIADKYDFKKMLGRSRQWRRDLVTTLYEEPKSERNSIAQHFYIDNENYRKIDLLISLFIGSINDATTLTLENPKDLLSEVKQKIILFDSDQTRFIYDSFRNGNKRIRIQGLSGTGKTELLLHKLKDVYNDEADSKIFFTCHNKVLADTLRKRIPVFFNRMKVQKQIEWDERLWCKNAWGSFANPDSGLLSYICNFYDVAFYGLRETGSFEAACRLVKKDIEQKLIEKNEYAFTYVFIDEAQDFNETMFELCELVTEKRVIIAGDTFQNIFNKPSESEGKVDYLLNKCYRTDPKTLMIGQALGMGLFEKEKLWWLEDNDWIGCGYNITELPDDCISLTREPIRRFEDLGDDYNSFELIKTNNYKNTIIEQIERLAKEYPSLTPTDIGVIYIDSDQYIYGESVLLRDMVENKLGWKTNLAYETKVLDKEALFISNRNNVKGLEFPFVFCVTSKIKNDYSYRNTLYTMISRSFLKTVLLCPDREGAIDDDIIIGIKKTLKDGAMVVKRPAENEKEEIIRRFEVANSEKSLRERVEMACISMGIPTEKVGLILEMANLTHKKLEEKTDDQLREAIDVIVKISEI